MTATAHTLPRLLFGAVAVVIVPLAATAATLGDIEVLSRPGEPLSASITVDAAATEKIEPSCVFLSRGSPETGPYVTGAKVALEARGAQRVLHIRSNEAVADAKARLRVVLRCPGETTFAYREYSALFSAQAIAPVARPTVTQPVAPAAPVATPAPQQSQAPAPTPADPATPLARDGFPVQPGDSLESIARLIFPRDTTARRLYVDALREANPALGSIAAREPLAAGTTLALPDLRTFARGRTLLPPEAPPIAAAPREAAPRKAPAADPPPRVARTPAPAPKSVASAERPKAPVEVKPRAIEPPAEKTPAKVQAPRAASPAAPAAPFVLKLSSGTVDLSRSLKIDDRERARIRERQRVFDSDDHVAAFLALRDSVQRLEGRVAELQLKLSTVSAAQSRIAAAEPAPAKVAPKVEPPAPPAKVDVPKVEPPKVEPPKVEPPKVEPAKVEPPKVEPPKVEPPKADAPKVEAPRKIETPVPSPAKVAEPASSLPMWLWGVVGVLVLLAVLIAWRFLSRRRADAYEEGPPSEGLPVPDVPAVEDPDLEHFEIGDDAAPIDVASPARREIDSDVELTTRLNMGDPTALRRRYLEERFPEIVNRTILLDDPDSVVKAARLFYQEGAIPRAVELLQFATEENPSQAKPWLALFEIYRLERLTGEFADLARRFKEPHGDSEYWRKVQFFGREIEPANPLYRDIAVGIETIKFEVDKAPPPATFDPIAENWLAAPMDFENEVLANELRRGLMNQAGLADQDLLPNPMPALRRVEMFTVA